MSLKRNPSALDMPFNPAEISVIAPETGKSVLSVLRIKKEAGALRKARPTLSQNEALKLVAQDHGFPTYTAARKASEKLTKLSTIALRARPGTGYEVALTARWHEPESRQFGIAKLAVTISEPWSSFLTNTERRRTAILAHFSIVGKDRSKLNAKESFRSEFDAMFILRKAANIFRFLDCARVAPASEAMVMPKNENGRYLYPPATDHSLAWFHPPSGGYFMTNEPYESALEDKREDQDRWMAEHGYQALDVSWGGMHNPPDTKLQFISAKSSPSPLQDMAMLLRALPPLPRPEDLVRREPRFAGLFAT